MVLIGEKLNSSIPSVRRLMDAGDCGSLAEIVKKQSLCKADFLDINTALCADEAGTMRRLCALCLENSGCGIVVDSPNPKVCEDSLAYIRERSDRPCIINSITTDERHGCIDTALRYGAGIVALLTTGQGIPQTAKERFANAEKAIALLKNAGICEGDIYIDVIVESAAANENAARTALETIALVRRKHPGVHILCGLSNISFGLPKRPLINRAFLTLAAYFGADCAICDVTSEDIRAAYLAAEVLNGADEFCMEYISAFRQ